MHMYMCNSYVIILFNVVIFIYTIYSRLQYTVMSEELIGK